MHLSALDFGVVALFVLAILALGFSARLRDASVLQYLAAGRRLSLPAFVATLVSTWYGGILGIGESVTYYGWGTWLLMGVPYYFFAIFYSLWLAKRVRGAEQISIPERLQARYGRAAALVGAGLIFLLAVPAAHVLMLGVLVESVTALPKAAAVVVAAVVGSLFLYKGGLLADVRVSILAFLMMYVGFGAMVGYCLVAHPPAATFAAIGDKNLLSFTGGQAWPVILSFFILGAWTLVDPGFHQRVSASASPDVGRRGVLVCVLFWLLFDVLSITTGMYALALLKPLPPDPLLIFPALGDAVLPAGLKALFLCGMLGTITSAMVGYSLVTGATVGREILARLKPVDDERVKTWTRYGIAVGTLVAILLALSIGSVVALWYAWSGCVVGALLLPVLYGYAGEGRLKAPNRWVLASMVLSFAASFAWLVYGQRTNNAFLEVVCLKIGGAWQIAVPPVSEALEKRAAESIHVGVGTLLPGLVISSAVLAIGAIVGRRTKDQR